MRQHPNIVHWIRNVVFLAFPAYVAAVLLWRFAFGARWTMSLFGVPLAILVGGVIACAIMQVISSTAGERSQ
jgi:hypothetical protein